MEGEENDKTDKINKIIESETVLPWDNFQEWIHCICIVTFDLELGQAMEMVYPGHVKLTDQEKSNVCYLSFPDSNSGCMGDTKFHFRIRKHSVTRGCHTRYLDNYNRNCPAALQEGVLFFNFQTDNGYYYGYVHFRQIKDKSIRRGYFQKSVVLISRFPFVTLFSHLLDLIAPGYFENGEPSLEAACHDIDQWAAPTPGETLNLPIMGSVIQIRLPDRNDKLVALATPRPPDGPSLRANHILPYVDEVDSYTAFKPVLPHIQMMWELVLTGQPIVVMAGLPTTSALTVQAIVNMISPLKYCSDYRPYFTIHDSEFKEYTTKTQEPPHIILGVTNPFFAKTLQHWPHVIRIGEMLPESQKGFNKLKKGGNLKTLDSKPGVYTRYKPFLSKDKTVLKRLAKGIQTKRPVEVQNAMMKRFLLEITQSFMIPLERYVASLMPLQRNISPYKGAPSLREFDTEEFIKTLESSGPQLTSGLKGDWVGLYREFFKSRNFEGWLRFRQIEVNQKLQALHVEALSKADLLSWIQDKAEVEVVDLILRIKEKLSSAKRNEFPVSMETVQKLQLHLDTIITSLPEDLQLVLRSN